MLNLVLCQALIFGLGRLGKTRILNVDNALEFSKHAQYMLRRKKIPEEWVWRVINTPDKRSRGDDKD
jgi:hypothetical protein